MAYLCRISPNDSPASTSISTETIADSVRRDWFLARASASGARSVSLRSVALSEKFADSLNCRIPRVDGVANTWCARAIEKAFAREHPSNSMIQCTVWCDAGAQMHVWSPAHCFGGFNRFGALARWRLPRILPAIATVRAAASRRRSSPSASILLDESSAEFGTCRACEFACLPSRLRARLADSHTAGRRVTIGEVGYAKEARKMSSAFRCLHFGAKL